MSFSIGRGRYRTETYPKPPFPAGIAPDGGLGTSYVFRQGGTPAPGVFVTSAALAAAMLLVDPAAFKVVTVDTVDAPGGVAHIETGVTLPDNVLFKGGGGSALPTLTFDEGSHLSGNTYQALDIVLVNAATATPVWSPSASTGSVLNLTGSELTPAGAGAVFCDAVGPVSVTAVESSVGDATHALFAVESTGAVDWLGFDGSTIFPNTIKQGSAPGGVVNFTVDGASQRGTSVVQVPVPTVTVLDPLTAYTFLPGGTDSGEVFTDFGALFAVRALAPNTPVSVTVDDSIAPAHTGAGTFLVNQCTFLCNFNATAILICDPGCVWTGTTFTVDGGLTVQQSAAATGPVYSLAAGGNFAYVELRGFFTLIESLGAQPFGQAGGGGSTLELIVDDVAAVGDGTHNAFNALAGGTVRVTTLGYISTANASQLAAHAIGGVGTAAMTYSGASGYPGNQDTTTQTFAYRDIENFVEGSGNTGTTTATVSAVTSTSIGKKKSGLMSVFGVATGQTSAPANVTVTLLRDATTIRTLPPLAVLNTAAFAVPIMFTDTAPDAAPHTYSCQVTASGGATITTGANGMQVQVREN